MKNKRAGTHCRPGLFLCYRRGVVVLPPTSSEATAFHLSTEVVASGRSAFRRAAFFHSFSGVRVDNLQDFHENSILKFGTLT